MFLIIFRQIEIHNKQVIREKKNVLHMQNTQRKANIQKQMRQSKSNIQMFWSDKIGRIQRDNEFHKQQNLNAQTKNEIILSKLEEEELSIITRLQKSQEIHDQLGKRLERAINLPHEDFLRMHKDDDDLELDRTQQILLNQHKQKLNKQNHSESNIIVKKSKIEEEDH